MRNAVLLSAAAAVLAGAALAGSFTPIGTSGGTYAFTECARPPAADVSYDRSLKGAALTRARNLAVQRYNDEVEATNAYFRCIAFEAESDMQVFAKAVSATLEAEQSAVLAALDARRQSLDLKTPSVISSN